MRFSFFISFIVFPMSIWALDLTDKQQIIERIKPVGQVSIVKHKTTNLADDTTQQDQTKEISGQTTYEKYCSVCHRDGLAGAPRFRVAGDWQSRLDKKTIDDLVAMAIKGVNAMPAKGSCIECSEDDLKNAIRFMLPQS